MTATYELPSGCRIAHDDEPGWYYKVAPSIQVWITDAPAVRLGTKVIITIDLDTGKYFIEAYRDGAVFATAFDRKLLNEIIARHNYNVVADYAAEVGK